MSGTDVRDDDPGAGHGFDESPELDLSPRTSAASAGPHRVRTQRPVAAYLALAGIVLAVGFVVLQALGGATLYFRNVDEAVAQRESLGDRRFRLQGLVRDDVAAVGDEVSFTVTFDGVDLAVRHTGDPPDLFGPGQSVVLEGRFAEGDEPVFVSDELFVKHSEEYEAENRDRIVDAEDGTSG